MKPLSPAFRPAVGLLLLSLLSGLVTQAVNARHGRALPWIFVSGSGVLREIELEGFSVVDTAGALERLETGTHLFLDARSLLDYSDGHIPGAMPLPIAEFEIFFPDLAPILLPDSPLVVYCSSATCDEALRLARRLREAGQEDVSVYVDGFEVWTREVGP